MFSGVECLSALFLIRLRDKELDPIPSYHLTDGVPSGLTGKAIAITDLCLVVDDQEEDVYCICDVLQWSMHKPYL